jgi:lysophospholipase L1-like esterase
MSEMANYVVSEEFYAPERGYGLVDQKMVDGETNNEKALNNGGWNLRSSFKGEYESCFATVSDGVKIVYDRQVLIYRIDVSEYGTYEVTVRGKADSDIRGMKIWTGRRNLVQDSMSLKEGEEYSKTFYTNVTPYIPALTSVPMMTKAIYICISGLGAIVRDIEVNRKDVPVIWIAGDSTLTDQNAGTPYYPYGSCTGWAQLLQAFVDGAAVSNHAHSGLTTNCFKDDGHWDIVRDRIKPGDVFVIQFGHNDQKRRNLSAFGGYKNNLEYYVDEVRKRGGRPVIVSPISRIPNCDDMEVYSLLEDYASACEMVAEEKEVPCIGLHKMTFGYWKKIGKASHDYFCRGDITHTNEYGARLAVNYIVEEVLDEDIEELSDYITGSNMVQILNPDSDTKNLPVETPEGGMFDIEMPYVDVDKNADYYEELSKGFKYGLFDPCVMHLHPEDEMPRAQLLMVLFKALRISGTRPYLGRFKDINKHEWDAGYIQTIVNDGIMDDETAGAECFRPDDALTVAEYSSFVVAGKYAVDKKKQEKNQKDSDSTFVVRSVDSKGVCNKHQYLNKMQAFDIAREMGVVDAVADPNAIITRAQCYIGLVRLMDILNVAEMELPDDVEVHPVG